MKGFKEGKFNILVATDVAARGLDVPDINLVIQCEPPQVAETYVHRSGRTGRAGKKGTCILFYQKKEAWAMNAIQRKLGKPFEMIQAPQPGDIMAAAASRCVEQLTEIDDELLPYFEEAAETLIKAKGAEKALCAALAQISGFTKPPPPTSMLSNSAGFQTFQLQTPTQMRAKGNYTAWGASAARPGTVRR